jgi:site-specific DNA recombinase
MPLRFITYARVSERGSDYAGETSCAAHIDLCRAAMAARYPKATECAAVVDEFCTGRNLDRPGMQRILADCRAGAGGWDALVVVDIDRVARSMEGFVDVLRVLQDSGRGLYVVRQDLDLASASGRFMMHLLVASSEYFARLNSSKTLDKMRWIASQGGWPAGRVPYGYRRRAAKDNVLVPDPQAAPLVQRAFADVAAGVPVAHVHRYLPVAPSKLYELMANPIYTGRIRYAGTEYAGKHEPIIDPATFAAVQALLPHRHVAARTERQAYGYALTGLIHCACGQPMQACTQTRGRTVHPYYRCRPCRRFVRADDLEAAVIAQVRDVVARPDVQAGIAEGMRTHLLAIRRAAAPELDRATAAQAEAIAAVDRLTRMATGGLVTSENAGWWNAELAKARAAASDAQANAAALERRLAHVDQTPEELASAFNSMAASMLAGTPDQRRAALRWHVVRVDAAGDAWTVSFSLPGVEAGATCSASQPSWHPQGESAEHVRLTVRVASRALARPPALAPVRGTRHGLALAGAAAKCDGGGVA